MNNKNNNNSNNKNYTKKLIEWDHTNLELRFNITCYIILVGHVKPTIYSDTIYILSLKEVEYIIRYITYYNYDIQIMSCSIIIKLILINILWITLVDW